MGRLEQMPESLVVEIFKYLSIQDIVRFQRTCKNFYSLLKEFPMILFNVLRAIYKSPFFPSDVRPTYQAVKRVYSKIHYSKSIMLEMFAYYTNGGYTKSDPFESMVNIFSSKLFDKCYSSVRENNILIKAIFCGGKFIYNVSRSEWEKKGLRQLAGIAKFEIELEDLRERLERVLRNTCKDIIITGFCIEKPSFMNKSSFKSCIIFSSTFYIKDMKIADSFNFIKDHEEVVRVSKSLGIEVRIVHEKEYSLGYFGKTNLELRPLLWVQFNDRNIGTDILSVEVSHHYLGSYLYILFLDSFNPYVSGLNIGTFITQGKILNLYE
jgi:hypothetical protein